MGRAKTVVSLLHQSSQGYRGANTHARYRAPENGMCGLPVEIWAMILEMVVEASFTSFKVTAPLPDQPNQMDMHLELENFPRSNLHASNRPASGSAKVNLSVDWNLLEFPLSLREWDCRTLRYNRWKDIRLVCRNWSNLVDPTWTPFIVASSLNDIKTGNRIRVLYIAPNSPRTDPDSHWSIAVLGHLSSSRDLYSYTQNITTIVIGSGEPVLTTNHTFIDFLLSHPKYFQNIRSLSVYVDRNLYPTFWTQLEKGFPQLLALRIRGWDNNGWRWRNRRSAMTRHWGRNTGATKLVFTMTNLEAVDISLEEIPSFNFPSLKHLVITAPMQKPYKHSRIFYHPTYSHSIESIIIIGGNLLPNSFFKTFWKTFPRLRFLGVQEHIFSRLGPPRPRPSPRANSVSHPLTYLWLIHRTKLDLSPDVAGLRAQIPQLRYLTVESDILSPPTRATVRDLCSQNGVAYVDVVDTGPKFEPIPPFWSKVVDFVLALRILFWWTILVIFLIPGGTIAFIITVIRQLNLGLTRSTFVYALHTLYTIVCITVLAYTTGMAWRYLTSNLG